MTSSAKALFGDSGLMLAVLDGLLRARVLDSAAVEDALSGIAGEHYGLDPDDDVIEIEHKRAQEAVSRLGALQVDESNLRAIEKIDFDGGNDIYMTLEGAIEIDSGGEENWYELRSLQGIERLSGLRNLNLDGYGYREDDLDLTPLSGHPTLRDLFLTGPCTNAAVLSTLPELKKLDVTLAQLDADDVLDELASRGVEVRR